MGFFSEAKPYTAVTSNIEQLTSEQYDIDDVADIVELIEVIHIAPTGPTEAARAIRKKLKYGNTHRQLRALTILESLVENGGKPLAPLYNDEYLLERLRLMAQDPMTDPKVKKRTTNMFIGWSNELGNTPGYERLAHLSKQLPRRRNENQRPKRAPPRYLSNDPEDLESDEEEDEEPEEEDEGPSRGHSSRARHTPSSSRDFDREDRREREERARDQREREQRDKEQRKAAAKKKKAAASSSNVQVVSIAKERPKIKETLAESGTAATNLTNALKLINREEELSPDNKRATKCFNECRALRRKVLRYIHGMDSEEFIGALIHANEELVEALQLYDEMSHPPDEDSDSDYENDDWMVDSKMKNLHVSSPRDFDDEPKTRSRSNSHRQVLAQAVSSSPKSPRSPARSPAASPRLASLPSPKQRRAPPPPAKPANLRAEPHAAPVAEDDDNPFADSNEADSLPKHTPMW